MVGGIGNTRGQHEAEKVLAICQQKQKLLCAKFLNFMLHLFMHDLIYGGVFVLFVFLLRNKRLNVL